MLTCTVTCRDSSGNLIKTYVLSGTKEEVVPVPDIVGYDVTTGNTANIKFGDYETIEYTYSIYKYTINWDKGTVKVGSVSEPMPATSQVSYGDTFTLPEITAPTGYTLAGWVNQETGETLMAGQKVPSLDKGTTLTYQATWTPITYKITYDLAGGTGDMIEEYTIEDSVTLVQPSKTGGSFAGWLSEGSTTSEKTITFKEQTGDKKYTATWDVVYYVRHRLQDSDQSHTAEYYESTGTTEYDTIQDVEAIPAKEGQVVTPTAKTDGVYVNYVKPDTSQSYTVPSADQGILYIDLQYPCHTTTLHWSFPGGKSADEQEEITIYQVRYGYTMSAYTAGEGGQFTAKPGYTLTGWTGDDGSTLTPGQGFTMPYIPDKDLTYTAQWEPNTDTPYTVVYHKLKVGGDKDTAADYVSEVAGTYTGTTDDTVAVKGADLTGFTLRDDSRGDQSITISGDGSSHIDFYYLRNSYTVTWNPDGGTISGSTAGTSATSTVEYGATITPPASVTKTGYTLKGWLDKDQHALESSSVMGAADCSYTAQWNVAGGIKYTVNYYLQNLNDDNYTLDSTDDTGTGTTGTSVPATLKAYTGFTSPEAQNVTIKADGSAKVDYYYTRNSYSITFKLDGGNISGSTTDVEKEFKYGAAIVPPTGVTRDGYTYTNWLSGNSLGTLDKENTSRTIDDKVVAAVDRGETITFSPNWDGEPSGYVVIHQKQNADDDQYVTATKIPVEKNVTVGKTYTAATLSYDGFEAPQPTSITILSADSTKNTVTYQYNRLQYDYTINLDGGKILSGASGYTAQGKVKYGATITLPTAEQVEKTGYYLTGWSYNNKEYTPGSSTLKMPNSAATVIAIWAANETKNSTTEETSNIEQSTDRFVVRNGEVGVKNVDSFTFSIGETVSDMEEALSGEEAGYVWENEMVRIDSIPQGYGAYIFKADTDGGMLGDGNYFQIYVDNGVIVGMATISPYFTYETSDGSRYLRGNWSHTGTGILSGTWNTMSGYKYSYAYYRETDDAYIVAYLDPGNNNVVYGTQIFSKTDGEGNTVTLKSMLDTSTIAKNGGYDSLAVDEQSSTAQNSMALELQEWARAYRFYYYTATSNSTYAVTKENEDGTSSKRNYADITQVAQIHAKYCALNKDDKTATHGTSEKAALKTFTGSEPADTTMAARFTLGYLKQLEKGYSWYSDYSKCYFSKEINSYGSPDALGFVTWWVDGAGSDTSTYRDSLLETKSGSNGGLECDQSSFRMVGGFAYRNDNQNFTYATLDVFAIE